ETDEMQGYRSAVRQPEVLYGQNRDRDEEGPETGASASVEMIEVPVVRRPARFGSDGRRLRGGDRHLFVARIPSACAGGKSPFDCRREKQCSCRGPIAVRRGGVASGRGVRGGRGCAAGARAPFEERTGTRPPAPASISRSGGSSTKTFSKP